MANDAFRFSTPIQVRFRDLDALGHVNNAVYFTYMEHARFKYFEQLGLMADDVSSIGFIIAEATCQFKAPIKLSTQLVVKARTSRIGNSSFSMDYRLEDEASGQVMATGRTINVAYDYAAGKSVPLPPDRRAAIEAFEHP